MSAAFPLARFQMAHSVTRIGAIGAMTTIAVSLLAGSASAQDRGPWWGQRPLPSRDEPVRLPSDLAERDAARLYADARVDLDADRLPQAQRKLEVLVAKHPMSALADVARRDLQRVYAILSAPPANAGPLPLGGQAGAIQPVAIHSPSAAAAGPALGSGAQVPTSGRASSERLANEDFRQQAGDRVFFPDGGAELGGRAKIALEAQANWLVRHPEVKVAIEGHADDQGSRELNIQLAEKRAEVVRLRLNDLGVLNGRMRVTGLARNEPVADCPEQHCKAQNRRVVTVIDHVPTSLGFDAGAKRSLGAAASAVGQPARAP